MTRSFVLRNVTLLASAQALSFSGNTLLIATSALVGNVLAVDKALSTLPQAMFLAAVTLGAIPASHIMRKLGRKAGFRVGALLSFVGALLGAQSVVGGDFWLFVMGCVLMGGGNAFVLYYRFAAAELSDEAFRPKAISLVLAGGVVAAVVGPELSKVSRDWLAPHIFAGTYLAAAALPVLAMICLMFVRFNDTVGETQDVAGGRSLGEIFRQPSYMLSAGAAMVGYGVMAFVMTATPLAIIASNHTFDDAVFVIEWHVLGMFVPAFFTGHLIARFGVHSVVLVGAILLLTAVLINLQGTEVINFWAALVSLGVGWNFIYVGATTLLTSTYEPAERSKAQGLNEFLVYGTAAVGSFSAGAVQNLFGWHSVNLFVLPLIVVTIVAVAVLRRRAHMFD